MYKYNYTDMVGGLFLVLIGVTVSAIAITSYPLGSPTRMGPGMFPAGLGVVLSILGIILSCQSLRRPGDPADIRVFSPIFVLGGIVAFALIIKPFGLLPAIIIGTVVSCFAELKIKPLDTLFLCVGLCLLAPFVFRVCLGLPLALFNWPG